MKKHVMKSCMTAIILAAALSILSVPVMAEAPPEEKLRAEKPRLIVITDIGTEPDDIQSLVRLLTYANEFDIEGLIASTSGHLRTRVHPEFIDRRIDAYGEVLDNLRVHDERYPDADALKAVVRASDPIYGMAGVGRGKHTEAAQLIIDAVDAPDSRPLWVAIWGGAAPLAEALWRVRESRSPQAVEAFIAKLRVYSISDQDDTSPWARMVFPELFWITSLHATTEYRLSTWVGIMSLEPWTNPAVIGNDWLNANIRDHGPLGALYPLPIFGVEGDTPSFLHLIPNGLGFPGRPDWGGWGGRHGKVADFLGLWTDVTDTVTGSDGQSHTGNQATVWRWREDFQNDFAARMDWTVAERYEDANHPPQPVLNGKLGLLPVMITACPGETIHLSADGSSDPDGQPLSFDWTWYREVSGIYSPELTVSHSKGADTAVTVGAWTQPAKMPLPDAYDMHVVLTVRDNGSPPLTRYRRAIVSILTAGGESDSGKKCEPVALAPPPAVTDFLDQSAGTAGAHFSTMSTIGALLDNPAARTVLEKHLPEIAAQAAGSEQARNMTLRGAQHFSAGITRELLQKIDEELAEVPRQ